MLPIYFWLCGLPLEQSTYHRLQFWRKLTPSFSNYQLLMIPQPAVGSIIRAKGFVWLQGNGVFWTQHGSCTYVVRVILTACTRSMKVHSKKRKKKKLTIEGGLGSKEYSLILSLQSYFMTNQAFFLPSCSH